jgi:hypothetical protein
MSKHIRNIYSKIDKQIGSAPKQSEPTKGLIGKRGTPTDEGLDPIVDYITYIREARGTRNGVAK